MLNTSLTKTNIYMERVAMFSLLLNNKKKHSKNKTIYINIAQNEIHGEIFSGLGL